MSTGCEFPGELRGELVVELSFRERCAIETPRYIVSSATTGDAEARIEVQRFRFASWIGFGIDAAVYRIDDVDGNLAHS